MQNNKNTKSNRIKCEIEKVVATKQAHFFIIVQLKNPSSQQNVKYRTETSTNMNRPKFKKNLFNFLIDDSSYTLKLGLMSAKSQQDKDATNAMVQGVCSIPITLQRLKELKNGTFEDNLAFTDRGKQTGQFNLKIKLQDMVSEASKQYDPLISRVLYNQDCSDVIKLQNNIKLLQQKLQGLYGTYKKLKGEENYFEKIYFDLEHDEKELKTQIDAIEKVNSKIEHRLEEKESLDNLKIQISMLQDTAEGKRVLFEKLQYFQDRIYRQIQDYEKLNLEYKKIRPIIDRNLKKAEEQAQKLKGKQMQQFEMSNNQKILNSYDDLLYQFKCHQQTIQSLMKMSSKSQLTAQQAKLLLSQVKYEIKLSQYESLKDEKQNRMLEEIERQIAQRAQDKVIQLSEEEEMIYKIKMSALEKEIALVRQKLRRVTNDDKKRF